VFDIYYKQKYLIALPSVDHHIIQRKCQKIAHSTGERAFFHEEAALESPISVPSDKGLSFFTYKMERCLDDPRDLFHL
jgi:hypothetical protein